MHDALQSSFLMLYLQNSLGYLHQLKDYQMLEEEETSVAHL